MPNDLIPIVEEVGNKAINSETVKPLRSAVGGTLSEVWQAIVGDKVAAWRVENAAEISRKLVSKLEAKGLKLDKDKVSAKYAFTWFEEASKQDQSTVQDLFATILANAVDGNEDALQERNLEVIAKFSPPSARLFQIVKDRMQTHQSILGDGEVISFKFRERQFIDLLQREYEFDDLLALDDLMRLGVIERRLVLDNSALESHLDELKTALESGQADRLRNSMFFDMVEPYYDLTLSRLGWSLARAIFEEIADKQTP
ncbi:hypothetical protein K3152_01525 [Qipengyuania sp. 1NDH17]|uniref:DUF4393 domain-containing protein n=1 Tax=Qipengyuania polymorpha TaxID=2867234 RepID=A0ABS7IXA6_9SPHN|nr:hypothetical protein [Qipengyuania polymorpha]MBX7456915.1 hypothetical protein [Qipengyuania polymorpha]